MKLCGTPSDIATILKSLERKSLNDADRLFGGNKKAPPAVQSMTGAKENVHFILPQDIEKCNMEVST